MYSEEQPHVREERLQPGNRRYTISIPKSYAGKKPVPLILALHFGGTVTPFYGKLVLTGLVEPALRELEAIVVAPDCTGADWTDEQSEKDALELIDYVGGKYTIDMQRVLITGYSMGGHGTWYLAARHQDLFSVALAMAGWPPEGVEEVEWERPLCAIHSRDDEVIPLGPTERAVSRMKAKGISVELILVDGITHYEVEQFVEPLRETVPWIRGVWQGSTGRAVR